MFIQVPIIQGMIILLGKYIISNLTMCHVLE